VLGRSRKTARKSKKDGAVADHCRQPTGQPFPTLWGFRNGAIPKRRMLSGSEFNASYKVETQDIKTKVSYTERLLPEDEFWIQVFQKQLPSMTITPL
jgi:hypothetical protein